MYSMVLLAALTTGTGAPDQIYGLGGYGWGGSGLGWGGLGGYGMGWSGLGGYGLGWGGWGLGYGTYPMGFGSGLGGYGYSPMISGWGWGSPLGYAGGFPAPGMTRSLYYSPAMAMARPGIEARIIVHLPPQATLTIDDQPTRQRAGTRIFDTPPLEPGKTYTYTIRGEMNRDGHFVSETKKVEVRAGQPSEVTLRFGDVSREELGAPSPKSSRPSEDRRDNR